MREYRINYLDGTTQAFASTGPQLQGDWLVFGDGAGELLRVPAEKVQSVSSAGLPERASATPKAA
jgi:hypothetical protein